MKRNTKRFLGGCVVLGLAACGSDYNGNTAAYCTRPATDGGDARGAARSAAADDASAAGAGGAAGSKCLTSGKAGSTNTNTPDTGSQPTNYPTPTSSTGA
jgi:hypothetical protein